tara:strand:- start:253 stop:543 length:291 start_codon:yes stop_codon:yes gene_type:complete
MAIIKRIENDKIEIVNSWSIQVRTATILEEDNVELSRSFHRHVVQPFTSTKDEDGKWTHTDTDISKEASEVQAIANAVWTDTVKANYKTFVESQES